MKITLKVITELNLGEGQFFTWPRTGSREAYVLALHCLLLLDVYDAHVLGDSFGVIQVIIS